MPEPVVQEIDNRQTKWEYVSSTVRYLGHASPSTKTEENKWRIKKLTFDSQGRHIETQYAAFNANFDHIWDNRASFNYNPDDPTATG